jgi:hypothetical protein
MSAKVNVKETKRSATSMDAQSLERLVELGEMRSEESKAVVILLLAESAIVRKVIRKQDQLDDGLAYRVRILDMKNIGAVR